MLTNILVPLDGSDLAEEAIGMAAALARHSRATIDLLMVHEPALAVPDASWNEKQIVAEQRYLQDIAAELRSGAGLSSRQTLVRGTPADLIGVRAADCGADLIVMTSHGRTGWSRAWIGSVADAVVRSSNVPVLMLKPNEQRHDRRALHKPVGRIVVPLDGSATATEIVPVVRDVAKCWNARVDLVRVVLPVPMLLPEASPMLINPVIPDAEATEAVRRDAVAQLEKDAGTLREAGLEVGHQQVTVSAQPAQAIVECARAREAGMIVMATHGRGRSRLLVGSIAEKVRRATDLPVLLHRPRFARVPQPEMTLQAISEQLPALTGMRG
jgi:nucleotide-binding universal stress UspA family protein